MKHFFLIILGLISVLLKAQSISPQVINSAGGGGPVGSTGVEVYYNIGEPVITTISNSNNVITQGFLQPDIVGEFGLVATAFNSPNSCADKTDGSIRIQASVSGALNQSDFQITYSWSSSSLCSGANTCPVVTDLPAGTYSVLVVSHYIGSGSSVPDDTVSITNIVINGSTEPCQISVYNGISPNNDGNNDFFLIENIEQFADNRVEIYNRWGQKLFETKGYNNTSNNWKGTLKDGGETAPSGTYFYIIDLGNGSKPVKGWLELTSNK